MSNKIPIRDGIFIENSDGGVLLGSQCRSCNTCFFPKGIICLNCQEDDLEDVELSRRGKLYSYATALMPSAHFDPPYSVGYIDLPENIRIFAPLKEDKQNPFKIGMDMEIVIGDLWEEDDKTVIGYSFKPV